MRVCDLALDQVVVGLQIKSLVSDRIGTVVMVDRSDDDYAWVLWEGDDKPYGGFYGNACMCICFGGEMPPVGMEVS